MKRLFSYFLFLVCCWALCVFPSIVKAGPNTQDTLVVSRTEGLSMLGQCLLIMGTDKELSPENVKLLPRSAFEQIDPSEGFNDKIHVKKHYWLKLLLRNDVSTDTLVFLQFHSQVIDVATAFQVGPTGKLVRFGQTGTDLHFNERMYPSYDMVFPIRLMAGQTRDMVIRLDTDDGDDIHLLPELTSQTGYMQAEQRFYIITGIMTGLMLVVAAFNLLMGFFLRNRVLHRWYAAYVLMALYEMYTMSGADIQYLYPNAPYLSGALQNLAPCTLGILMTTIMRYFLEHKTRPTFLAKVTNYVRFIIIGMIGVCIVSMIWFGDDRVWEGIEERILAVILLVQCLLFLACAFERIIQGFKPAWFYLAAIAFFNAGLIQFICMVLFGIWQRSVLSNFPNLIQWGIMAETIVVFVGIVYKNKQDEIDHIRQRKAAATVALEATETERERIGQELHDGVATTLALMGQRLSSVLPATEREEVDLVIGDAVKLAGEAYDEARALSHELAPGTLMKSNLFDRIRDRMAMLNTAKITNFQFFGQGSDEYLPPLVSKLIYHITSEILVNITKHAVASEASVQIFIDVEELRVSVDDNGRGFDPAETSKNGIGLRNLRGRVAFMEGVVEIDSGKQGTHIHIIIPDPYGNSKKKN